MEQEELQTPEEELQLPEKEGYVPRPAWQVWLARIALIIFILVLISYYLNLFWGGA